MHSGFPTKMVEQMIVTSLNDVTRISHADSREGTIKGEAQPSSRSLAAAITVASGCCSTSVRVFTKPQTLYLGCLGAP